MSPIRPRQGDKKKGNRAMCDKEALKKAGYSARELTLVPIIPEKVMKGATHISKDFIQILESYRNILAATAAIDFGCEFTPAGTCKGQYGGTHLKAAMCCCAGCRGSEGYFYGHVLCTPKEFLNYKKKWDTMYGFWRPGKGCVLPRGRRSVTCLFFNCLFKDEANKDKSDAVDKMRAAAQTLERRLKSLLKEI